MCSSYRSTPFRLIISLAFVNLGLSQQFPAIPFLRGNSTCVSESAPLYDTFGKTASVKVQPNCDIAINALCSLAPLKDPPMVYATYTAIGPNNSAADPEACQAHLVGLGKSNLLEFNYATCIQGFQNITIDCMLLNYGKRAKKGMQAGVRGVLIEFPPLPANGSKVGEEGFLPPKNVSIHPNPILDPGFLVGPPGYFGDVSAIIAGGLDVPVAPVVVKIPP
ncbi:MAG: hypothetical protein L6R38_003606 [Xanthoria sp. 2 TBL-2021]|nr:MAG: hypothetical protein L6R38_003606 [Xanthoria sp. 2 TBL-2021]